MSRRRKPQHHAPNPLAQLDGTTLTDACCAAEIAVSRHRGLPALVLLHEPACPAPDGDRASQTRVALAVQAAAARAGLCAVVLGHYLVLTCPVAADPPGDPRRAVEAARRPSVDDHTWERDDCRCDRPGRCPRHDR